MSKCCVVVAVLLLIVVEGDICDSITSCKGITIKGCGWCPILNRAMVGTINGPSVGNCSASARYGQWTFYTNNCPCLSATTCMQISGTNCGWCPSQIGPNGVGIGHAYIGTSTGPSGGISCEASEKYGQWTFDSKNCACLSATTCMQISGTNCGWCPSQIGPNGVGIGHAYIGSSTGPSGGISCKVSAEYGQWTWTTKNCACLSATTCMQISGTDCGWCPSQIGKNGVGIGHAYIGSSTGPSSGLTCVPSAKYGQWTWNSKDCTCLSATTCKQTSGTNCGWCPSQVGPNGVGIGHAYIGSSTGPSSGITCKASEKYGKWIWKC